MKKVWALLLLATMLIPMCVFAEAESVADKPFYLVNMSDVSAGEFTNVYGMPVFFGLTVKAENPIVKVYWSDTSADRYKPEVENFSIVAAALKAETEGKPVGTRFVFIEALRKAFNGCVEDGLFMEKGVEATKIWMEGFLKEYKRIGGELDGLVIDLEYDTAKAWFVYATLEKNDPYIFTKIVNNPKYQTLIRPHLVERGFKFYEDITDKKSEIYSIHPHAGAEYSQCSAIWNGVIQDLLNQYVNQACAPLFDYYPDAILTDYPAKSTYSWLKEVDRSGGEYVNGGNVVHTVGNRSSEYGYTHRPSIQFYDGWSAEPVYTNVVGYNNAIYENIPYNYFLMDANIFKTTAAAAKDGKVSYWIADWDHNRDTDKSSSRTPYYTETVIHLTMLDPDPLLGYLVPIEIVGANNTEDPDYIYALEVADDIMREMTRVLGKADRKPIPTYNDWNSKFYISGMYAGGKNYWRVTPDTSVVSLENFKVEGADPTFSAAGKTVTFPGGKIIPDGNVREVGTCGYWVETAADASPIITATEDYYYKYPAYTESFDQYANGVELDSKTALPAGVWTTEKEGNSSGMIQNGALEIKGKFSLTNVKLPQNVNAVDVYAKRQGWEVEVTIPTDMAARAEIVLLNCVDKAKNTGDLGLKIAGDRIFYGSAEGYLRLDGVTAAPGSKYIIRREIDMSVEGACTSDYYIYDVSGALLGSAENVPLTNLSAPVTKISMSCKDVAGEPVVLDNYKLFLTDTSLNFELYDAVNGMLVKDISAAREKDTAYRLSWVNATSEQKHYTVVAAYYNGDTLVSEQVVREVTVDPNADGVVTGIVKNETAGQTLKVYYKEVEPPAPNEETPDIIVPDGTTDNSNNVDSGDGKDNNTDTNPGVNTDTNENNGGKKIDWWLIIAAVVIVAAINGAVYVLVIRNKGQKKK